MANLLKMAVTESIHALNRRGWSQRRIADALGINRETVARHLRQADLPSKPANVPLGSPSGGDEPKPAHAPLGSHGEFDASPQPVPPPPAASQRPSTCEPWRSTIEAKLQLGLSARSLRIF